MISQQIKVRLSNWLVCVCAATLGSLVLSPIEEEENDDGDVGKRDKDEFKWEDEVAERNRSREFLRSVSLNSSFATSVLDPCESWSSDQQQETHTTQKNVKKSKFYTNTGRACSVTAAVAPISVWIGFSGVCLSVSFQRSNPLSPGLRQHLRGRRKREHSTVRAAIIVVAAVRSRRNPNHR